MESLKTGWKYNLEPSLPSRNQTLVYQHNDILNLYDITELRDTEILVWDSSITECCGKWSWSTFVTSQLYISILVGHYTLFPLKTSSHSLNSVILKWKTLRFKLCSSKVSCSPQLPSKWRSLSVSQLIFSWYEIKESTKGFMEQPTGLLTCLVRKSSSKSTMRFLYCIFSFPHWVS